MEATAIVLRADGTLGAEPLGDLTCTPRAVVDALISEPPIAYPTYAHWPLGKFDCHYAACPLPTEATPTWHAAVVLWDVRAAEWRPPGRHRPRHAGRRPVRADFEDEWIALLRILIDHPGEAGALAVCRESAFRLLVPWHVPIFNDGREQLRCTVKQLLRQ